MKSPEFDLVVVGGGPGGYTGAIRASQLGLKTALVEKSASLGGTCLNVGCIPSKALLESSKRWDMAKRSLREEGICASGLSLDLQKMMSRKQKIVSDLTKGIRFLMKKNKIEICHGYGRLLSPGEVEWSAAGKTKTLLAKNIMLATGSEPVKPPFAKEDGETVVSSTEALSWDKVPKTLIVIGGGFIGLELGSVWSRLGSQVTVLEYGPFIAPSMDRDISKKLLSVLRKQGMAFYLQSRVAEVRVGNKSAKVFWTDKENKSHSLQADKVLVSVGRKPFSKGLGLENAGLKTNAKGQLEVNRHLQTGQNNIFAIGDLIPGPMLAHKAEEEGVAVAEFIAKGWSHVNYETVPGVIYTAPAGASVGKTEQELKEGGIPFLSGAFPFTANARAYSLGETEGFVKVLAHKTSDKVLGVHILGPHAGDLIATAVSLMEFHGSSEDMARNFYAHPTLSEAMREAALNVHKKARQM